jgi:hypothetical protein
VVRFYNDDNDQSMVIAPATGQRVEKMAEAEEKVENGLSRGLVHVSRQ